jgi:[acyl-carrier-protein] S-malonyltransferase
MIACVFAGQGSQFVGMGQNLCKESPRARAVYEEAADLFNLDLLNLDETMLAQTRYAQLGIVTLSLAGWQALQAEVDLAGPLAFAGFSLGEYSAMGAAGILSSADVLRLVDERSRLMQATAEANPGAMYAVLGLDEAKLAAVLAEPALQDQVYAVNFNCPGQIVIAGSEQAAAQAADALKAAGAKRVLKLNVNGAFHTRFMEPAAASLSQFAKTMTFNKPSGLFFSNRSAAQLPADLDWPAYLAQHMCSPVKWTGEVQAISAAGADTYIEFGPGKTLSGLIKKILTGAAIANIEDPASLQAAAALLRSAATVRK